MTNLEDRLYLALLGARPIVSAQANVNGATIKVLQLIDRVTAEYKAQKSQEETQEERPEIEHAP
jgi:hypothetical protein